MLSSEKRHFVFLDGMRGIAALAVGWLHASIFFRLSFEPHHASLAVDFFFVLSGFVIAYAYDRKLTAGMTFRDFVVKRFIRLYPLIFLGVVLGSMVTIASSILNHSDMKVAIALSLSAVALVPLGTLLGQQPYPVNNPIWSLFFEIIANAVYGLCGGRHKERSPAPLIALGVSAILLVAVIHHYGTIERVGFSGKLSLFLGLVRVCFPFLAGVLIYRYKLGIRGLAKLDLVLALVLAGIFVWPFFQESWVYDSISIVVLFPLVVMLGLNTPDNRLATAVWKILGNLSYPFYLIHQPIIRAANILYQQRLSRYFSPEPVAISSVIFATVASYFIFLAYDQPVRRWLAMSRERAFARNAARSRNSPRLPIS